MAKKKLSFSYDKRADVLYLSLGKPQKALSREVDDGVLIRLDPKTKNIIGITIIDFSSRFKSAHSKSIPLQVLAELQPA